MTPGDRIGLNEFDTAARTRDKLLSRKLGKRLRGVLALLQLAVRRGLKERVAP
jgi:hypothetical protein